MTKHVCSLEWAKKLKEAGYKQEGIFFYNSETMKLQKGFTSHTTREGIMKWSIAAPIATEILEKLSVEDILKYCLFEGKFEKEDIILLLCDVNQIAQMYCYLAGKNSLRGEK